jgi:hypothetical protein
MARHRHNSFLTQHRVFRQHPVEIGAQPVGQVVGLDRSAKPARMKATGNSGTDLDPRNPFADRFDLAGAVETAAPRRFSSDLDRRLSGPSDLDSSASSRAPASGFPFARDAGPRSIPTRSQYDPINAPEALDAIGFHLPSPTSR